MPIEILLVEDSPGDVRLTEEAFRAVDPAVHLNVAKDGVEAMAFLNMPRMDGREVLARIKEDASLKTIPIVILTTSDSDRDIVKSYQLHANSYVCKPVQLRAFETLVKSIYDFWLTKAKLPQTPSP
jgi:chemotaxis family two-component system response regulator Rcp1